MRLGQMTLEEIQSTFCGYYRARECEGCPASEYSPHGPQCALAYSAALWRAKTLEKEVEIE